LKKFLFITDAISSLVEYKDTSVLMMQTAFENNISIYVCEIKDLFYSDNVGSTVCSKVNDPFNSITDMEETVALQLIDFDKVFMRKDPPVDENYMNALYLLEVASSMGANIMNEPKALQTFNEKVLALRFAKFMTETLITNQALTLKEFHAKHHEIILKPLNGMGGFSIFKLNADKKIPRIKINKISLLTSIFLINTKINIIELNVNIKDIKKYWGTTINEKNASLEKKIIKSIIKRIAVISYLLRYI